MSYLTTKSHKIEILMWIGQENLFGEKYSDIVRNFRQD